MFNFFSESIWAIYQPAMANLLQMMRRMPSSGPADDASRAGLPVQVRGTVAVVPINGAMVKADSWINAYLGLTSTVAIKAAIQSAVADASIETIVLLIDSPGGSVYALAELGDAVAAANAVKPVVAQVDSIAASAAYYVASRAGKIYAGRMDMVGSIGTRMVTYDMSVAFAADGVETLVFDTGEFKSAGEPGTVVTDAQKAEFQRMVDGYFADFRVAVRAGRGLTDQQFDAVADGRMFFAAEALTLGLIDGIQSYEFTMEKISGGGGAGGRSTAAARRRVNASLGLVPSL